jgi:phospho-N-acetylmuramoyl-pentapeptide-transferase
MKWFYGLFILFLLVGTSNAVNLTDGLDGLAGGLSAIAFLAYGLISWGSYWINGYQDIGIFCFILVGSIMGFLVFNTNPAKVFMGDTGSLALGGAFCSVAIMLKNPLILVVVAGICVLEAVSVILQVSYFKLTKGKRLFKMAPFHHHLELSGMKETVIVPLFWGITILLCIIGYKII